MWVHRRCTKKKLSVALAQSYICASSMKACTASKKELCDDVETAKDFCYLGDRLNASGSSEAAVTSTTRIGWIKFTECSEVRNGKLFSL